MYAILYCNDFQKQTEGRINMRNKKTMFHSQLFQNITIIESIFALILVALYEIGCVFVTFITIKANKAAIAPLVCIAFSFVFFILIVLLNITKLDTLGLKKGKLSFIFVTFIILFIVALLMNIPHIQQHKISIYDFMFNALFYLVMMFFVEEFIYRGYLWPRLVILTGKHTGTILCGSLWGIIHLILGYIYGAMDLNILQIINSITSGIVGQYIFCSLYSYAQNIYLPTIIHASLHFFRVDRTIEHFLSICIHALD